MDQKINYGTRETMNGKCVEELTYGITKNDLYRKMKMNRGIKIVSYNLFFIRTFLII